MPPPRSLSQFFVLLEILASFAFLGVVFALFFLSLSMVGSPSLTSTESMLVLAPYALSCAILLASMMTFGDWRQSPTRDAHDVSPWIWCVDALLVFAALLGLGVSTFGLLPMSQWAHWPSASVYPYEALWLVPVIVSLPLLHMAMSACLPSDVWTNIFPPRSTHSGGVAPPMHPLDRSVQSSALMAHQEDRVVPTYAHSR